MSAGAFQRKSSTGGFRRKTSHGSLLRNTASLTTCCTCCSSLTCSTLCSGDVYPRAWTCTFSSGITIDTSCFECLGHPSFPHESALLTGPASMDAQTVCLSMNNSCTGGLNSDVATVFAAAAFTGGGCTGTHSTFSPHFQPVLTKLSGKWTLAVVYNAGGTIIRVFYGEVATTDPADCFADLSFTNEASTGCVYDATDGLYHVQAGSGGSALLTASCCT